jgi:hypothetical protein
MPELKDRAKELYVALDPGEVRYKEYNNALKKGQDPH